MVQKPKTFQDLQAGILSDLSQTGISQLARGGKARAFGDIFASECAGLEGRYFSNLAETLLPFATGTSLDLIGGIYGVARIEQQTASVSVDDGNFRFYVRSGTFGSINNGLDITVPKDVRILPAAGDGPVYLTDTVILPAGVSEKYFSARCLAGGEAGNVPALVFSRHNFNGYADSRFGSLQVTNNFGIVGGRDREDDESFRYRIRLKIQSSNGSNEAALRFELLQIPGIRDVVFDSKAGTFLCYIYAITPVPSAAVMANAQARLNSVSAFPITGVAVSPELVGITLATTIKLTSSTPASEQAQVLTLAQAAVSDYINNLGTGEMLVLNEMADRLRSASDRILDIGLPNKPLDEVYIWRARTDGSRYSRYLTGNYTPSTGERLVVEDRTNAVSLTIV